MQVRRTCNVGNEPHWQHWDVSISIWGWWRVDLVRRPRTPRRFYAGQAGYWLARQARGEARGPKVRVAVYWMSARALVRAYKLVAITRSVGLIFLVAGTGGLAN